MTDALTIILKQATLYTSDTPDTANGTYAEACRKLKHMLASRENLLGTDEAPAYLPNDPYERQETRMDTMPRVRHLTH
jgi:hypothetical protein